METVTKSFTLLLLLLVLAQTVVTGVCSEAF